MRRPFGRLVGDILMPESESPEYYYLVQQQTRIEFTRKLLHRPLVEYIVFPIFLSKVLFWCLRIAIVNALIRSYLNERELLASIDHDAKKNGDS
jgi:hypothetical protein